MVSSFIHSCDRKRAFDDASSSQERRRDDMKEILIIGDSKVIAERLMRNLLDLSF